MYHAVILCGGAGTRLWPLTRQAMPKQFLPLTSDKPLLVETYERLRRSAPPERIWLVGGRLHDRSMRELLPQLPPGNVIVEPIARDSAGAVGLAMARLLRQDPDAVFTAFASDHIVRNDQQFDAAVALASRIAADGPIVNVGAAPTYPETGYGYVERGRQVATGAGVVAFEVIKFHEKPDAARAAEYVRSGRFLWNVGMFTWRASVIRDLFHQHQPGSVERFEATDRMLERDPDGALAAFSELPRISIDYAILEKATNRVVIEADLGWLDVGDWSAIGAVRQGDTGPTIRVDAEGSYLWSSNPSKVLAAVGVGDLVVVDTDDALLVVPRSRAQDVKRVVDELKARGLDAVL
jgi:mannose-1-phosphate guanylyltransferase